MIGKMQPKEYTKDGIAYKSFGAFLQEREDTIKDGLLSAINAKLTDKQQQEADIYISILCDYHKSIPTFNAHIKVNKGGQRHAQVWGVTAADGSECLVEDDIEMVAIAFAERLLDDK